MTLRCEDVVIDEYTTPALVNELIKRGVLKSQLIAQSGNKHTFLFQGYYDMEMQK